ncbi:MULTISPECIES: hypothetical protein [unclassified Bacteroides]|uniref:hypothetical protein n=1 Tax=unclassified Bacteroides TaxID=2646097 RepID=UPI00168B56CA|nr:MULTISPECIES: hypothetical protein [unclassified Bacteroides]MBD3591116.1 hypothetical protein [Bacteroides sp. GM023]
MKRRAKIFALIIFTGLYSWVIYERNKPKKIMTPDFPKSHPPKGMMSVEYDCEKGDYCYVDTTSRRIKPSLSIGLDYLNEIESWDVIYEYEMD